MNLMLWLWTILTGSKFKALAHEGQRLLRTGRANEAMDAFRAMVKGWPQQPEGYLGMAAVYQAMSLRLEAAREKAIGQGLTHLATHPEDLRARLEVAEALMDKEMFDWAAHHADLALRLAPEDQKVLRLAARAHRRNNNHRKAVVALRRALRQDPLDPELYDLLTASLRASGNHAEAARIGSLGEALQALKDNPTDPGCLVNAVRQFLTAGYLRLAVELVESCVAQGADHPRIHLLRASLMLEDRKPKEALAALHKAMALDPLNLDVHRLLTDVHEILSEGKQADYHRRLVRVLGSLGDATTMAANMVVQIRVLVELGNFPAAHQIRQNLARDFPKDWRTFYVHGLLAREEGDLAAAERHLMAAKERNDTSPEVHMEIARLRTALGEKIEAVGEARVAVKLAPRDGEIRRAMAQVLRQNGFMDQAIEEDDIAEALEKSQARR